MGKSRKRRSGKEKLQIVKEGQQNGASVAEVCRHHGINTGLYYQWQKQAEKGALDALEGGLVDKPSSREQRLERELERMKSVVVEITAENLELKKTFGK